MTNQTQAALEPLLKLAEQEAQNSYSPYSKFRVGAAAAPESTAKS